MVSIAEYRIGFVTLLTKSLSTGPSFLGLVIAVVNILGLFERLVILAINSPAPGRIFRVNNCGIFIKASPVPNDLPPSPKALTLGV